MIYAFFVILESNYYTMKKLILFVLTISLMSCSIFKKEPKVESVDINKVYTVVEKQPEYPGGADAMFSYLGKTIKYPQAAKEAGVKGKVYVSFVIERNGSISNIKVLRGIGSGCDEEGIKAVKNMPNWTPGEIRNQTVRVQYVLPINFSLR